MNRVSEGINKVSKLQQAILTSRRTNLSTLAFNFGSEAIISGVIGLNLV